MAAKAEVAPQPKRTETRKQSPIGEVISAAKLDALAKKAATDRLPTTLFEMTGKTIPFAGRSNERSTSTSSGVLRPTIDDSGD
jgi:hypothetical protein